MAEKLKNIRNNIKRRMSHKDKHINFDEHDEADEETTTYLQKEIDDAEKGGTENYGKPGSLLNRLIMHGNKKTEEEIAADMAKANQSSRTTQS